MPPALLNTSVGVATVKLALALTVTKLLTVVLVAAAVLIDTVPDVLFRLNVAADPAELLNVKF